MNPSRLGFALFLLGGFGIARLGVAQRPNPASAPRIVLATFKVEPHGRQEYEFRIALCRQTACMFEVRLRNDNLVVSTLDLDWAKAYKPLTKDNADESSGVGDPLEVAKQIIAWSTGEGKDNVSTVARTVRLTPQLNGLLIDQRAGFDLLKRHHDLVVAVDGRLVRAWTDQEGAGPTWSTVVVADSAPNAPQEILAFNGFRQPSNDLPDWLSFRAYEWDPNTHKLASAANGTPELHAVLAGSFKTAAEAHAAQVESDCLGGFWVLKSDAFVKLEPGTFVLAAVSTKKQAAADKLEAVRACAPKVPTSMIDSYYSLRE